MFLALMIPNALFYFAWDTLVLSTVVSAGFTAACPIASSCRSAPRPMSSASSTRILGRGAMAAYLRRRLHAPFLELGSTVMFLVLTEYTQLVLWAMFGLLGLRAEVSRQSAAGGRRRRGVLVLFLYTKLHVTPTGWSGGCSRRASGRSSRTFRLATPARYGTIVLLRAPMFFVSLVPALLRGARVRHPHPVRADAGVPAGDLHDRGAADHRRASRHDASGVDLLLQPVRAGAAAAGVQPRGASRLRVTRALLGVVWLPVVYLDLVPAGTLSRQPAVPAR